MKSPIGLFLTEFPSRGAPPLLLPEPPGFALADDADALDFAMAVDEPLLIPVFPEADPEPAVLLQDDPMALPTPEAELPALPDIAAPEADHAAALVAARQEWAEAEGAALAGHLDEALAAFETRLADTLVPLIEPFLVRGAQLKVIAGLREALRGILDGEGCPVITLTGPADLLAAIEAGHTGGPPLAIVVADTPDVTITAGDTLVRSRLGDWAALLEASLGEDA